MRFIRGKTSGVVTQGAQFLLGVLVEWAHLAGGGSSFLQIRPAFLETPQDGGRHLLAGNDFRRRFSGIASEIAPVTLLAREAASRAPDTSSSRRRASEKSA